MSKIPGAIARATIHAHLLEQHPEIHGPKIAGRAGNAAAFLEEAGGNLESALKALTDALPGPAAANYDSAGGGHGTVLDDEGIPMPAVPDPTGEAAIRPCTATLEWAKLAEHANQAELAALHIRYRTAPNPTDAVLELYDAAHEIWVIVQRWAPRTPGPIDQRTTPAPPGCESCARDRGHWAPIARAVKLEDGTRQPLCEWCRCVLRDHHRLPKLVELEQHHQGRKVRFAAKG